ncbi:MAG: ATP-grasp domain-containing protein [Candidatus Bathyarchaeota archaeon]|nr:ATP-grasp domain-containing protein [Candidatus Bathyarchaeota archaeon]MDH5747200.1 ATP-grasp domain-containing protein [Candidatus Bathyarchaeota archaeon]
MPKTEIQNLLVVGIDTVSIANSAKKAGYKIYAADYFGDTDLRRVCAKHESIIQQRPGKSCGKFESRFKPEAFLQMTRFLLKKVEIDAALLSSGLDDYSNVLNELNELVPIIGNRPEVIKRVREKPKFFEELKRLRIPHPEAAFVRDIKEAERVATEIGYPVVIKPSRGFGGAGIGMAQSPEGLKMMCKYASLGRDDVLIQKFIDGIHASASLLASHAAIKILTINEQLIGLPYVFQQEPFGYCGNVVPLRLANSVLEECRSIGEKVVLNFGLRGSNGIDFVISKGNIPYVVEVNPRFQGTLECVERILGINLVKEHINACIHDSLPIIEERSSNFCTRLILYTPARVIAPDLTYFRGVRDIPLLSTIIEKGEPLCSVIAVGNSRRVSLRKAKRTAQKIYTMLCPA